MTIQWFPGHMAKARNLIQKNIKLVDVVIELIDARIPIASRNPNVSDIIGNKPRLIALNKADMADSNISNEWKEHFLKIGEKCVFVDSITGKGLGTITGELKEIMKPVFEKSQSKGRIFRPIRVLVIGIPNVGKSSFINKISGRSIAQTGDRPGVTRANQWIRVSGDIELLDTPGILWPKFDDEEVALNLAFTGAIKDDILDTETLALKLIERLIETYPKQFAERYKLDPSEFEATRDEHESSLALEIMEKCAKSRGCLIKGGEIDYTRISAIILDEFRGTKIGKISLERPVAVVCD